jgi:hypothetical protein
VPQGVCAANVLKSKIGASEALMEADQERQFCSMAESLMGLGDLDVDN